MERRFYTATCACILIFIFACTPPWGGSGGSFSDGDGEYVGEAVCRHRAAICAFVAAEQGYPTRMMYGPSNNIADVWHIQTDALIDGEWVPLCIDSDFIVFECERNDWYTVESEKDPWRYIEYHLQSAIWSANANLEE